MVGTDPLLGGSFSGVTATPGVDDRLTSSASPPAKEKDVTELAALEGAGFLGVIPPPISLLPIIPGNFFLATGWMLPMEYGGGDSVGVGGFIAEVELSSLLDLLGVALDGNSGASSSILLMAISKNFRSPLHARASVIMSSDLNRLGATHTARFFGFILLASECCATSAMRGSRCRSSSTRLLLGNPSSRRPFTFKKVFSSPSAASSNANMSW